MWMRHATRFIGFLAFRLPFVHRRKPSEYAALRDCDFVVSWNVSVDELGTTCYDVLLEMADDEKRFSSRQQRLHHSSEQTSSYLLTPIILPEGQAPTSALMSNPPYGLEPPRTFVLTAGSSHPQYRLAILYILWQTPRGILYEMGQV
jgi:hypothetical protein